MRLRKGMTPSLKTLVYNSGPSAPRLVQAFLAALPPRGVAFSRRADRDAQILSVFSASLIFATPSASSPRA